MWMSARGSISHDSVHITFTLPVATVLRQHVAGGALTHVTTQDVPTDVAAVTIVYGTFVYVCKCHSMYLLYTYHKRFTRDFSTQHRKNKIISSQLEADVLFL